MHNIALQHPIFDQNGDMVAVGPPTNRVSADWKMIELSQAVKEFISGGTPSTKRTELWDGLIPWTTSATISEDDITLGHTQRFITELGLQESASHLVPKGSLLVGTRVGVGKAVVNLFDVAISQDLTGVVLDTGQVQPEFVAYQFKTKRVQQILAGSKRGTTIKGISRFDLQSVQLYLPPLPEQRAIAHILQTVQNAIQARRKEIELERERKAAVMQHIFTHGTRKEPVKVSALAKMPYSWNIAQLKDVIHGQPQNGAFIKNPQMGKGTLYVNVYDTYQSAMIGFEQVERLECDLSLFKSYLLKENDLVFVRSSLKREGVGQCCLIKNLTEPAIFDCHLIKISPNMEIVDPLYVVYYFLSERGKSDLIARSKTTTMTTMNQNILIETVFPMPSIEEQKEIAECLCTCDSKIAALEKEVTLHEEFFRALLDELMTGRLSALPLVE